MKVLVVEVCRSPERDKGDTEAVFLARQFDKWGLAYRLYSNDGVWPEKTETSRDLLENWLLDWEPNVVHLATHGDDAGLILQWSDEETVGSRRAMVRLTAEEIRSMHGWSGRIVLSGACASGALSDDFLAAGANVVVAPTEAVAWRDLARFFGRIYDALRRDPESLRPTVHRVVEDYPDLSSYRVYSPVEG